MALEQVRQVHGVPGVAQLLGEVLDAVGESLDVVEHEYLGHACVLLWSWSARLGAPDATGGVGQPAVVPSGPVQRQVRIVCR